MRLANCFKAKYILFLAVIVLVSASIVYSQKEILKDWWRDRSVVSIGAGDLTVTDMGKGAPAIVIATGVGVSQGAYRDLQERLSSTTRIVSFDRPGLGFSPDNSDPKTLDFMIRDMKELLEEMAVPKPYVLLGHSMGGHIIHYYAATYPEDVKGLIFIDYPHEGWFNYIRTTWADDEVAEYFKWWSVENPSYKGARLKEILAYEKNGDFVKGLLIPSEIPVLMFTGNNSGHFRKDSKGKAEDTEAWVNLQKSHLEGITDAKHIIDLETGHWPQRDKPEMVQAEIKAFVEKLRQQ